MTHYVLMLLFSTDLKRVVTLQKKSGPRFLRNKWTFPGGHVETDDASIQYAASREMSEETGVFVSVATWVHGGKLEGEHFLVDILVGVSDEIDDARTLTQEPVRIVEVAELLKSIEASPDDYAPDVPMILKNALALPYLQVEK